VGAALPIPSPPIGRIDNYGELLCVLRAAASTALRLCPLCENTMASLAAPRATSKCAECRKTQVAARRKAHRAAAEKELADNLAQLSKDMLSEVVGWLHGGDAVERLAAAALVFQLLQVDGREETLLHSKLLSQQDIFMVRQLGSVLQSPATLQLLSLVSNGAFAKVRATRSYIKLSDYPEPRHSIRVAPRVRGAAQHSAAALRTGAPRRGGLPTHGRGYGGQGAADARHGRVPCGIRRPDGPHAVGG
jgi:hypothetical protein